MGTPSYRLLCCTTTPATHWSLHQCLNHGPLPWQEQLGASQQPHTIPGPVAVQHCPPRAYSSKVLGAFVTYTSELAALHSASLPSPPEPVHTWSPSPPEPITHLPSHPHLLLSSHAQSLPAQPRPPSGSLARERREVWRSRLGSSGQRRLGEDGPGDAAIDVVVVGRSLLRWGSPMGSTATNGTEATPRRGGGRVAGCWLIPAPAGPRHRSHVPVTGGSPAVPPWKREKGRGGGS